MHTANMRGAGLVSLAAGFVVMMSGCSTNYPIRVDSDYGPGLKMCRMGPYYAWRPGSEPTMNEPTAPYYELKDFVYRVIECELEQRGFRRVAADAADFWVDARLCTKLQGDPYDLFVSYEVGALVVHVIDPRTRYRIWRGWAETRAQDSVSPQQRRERIAKAVEKVIDEFPYQPDLVREAPLEEAGEAGVIYEGPGSHGVIEESTAPPPATMPAH